MGVLRFDAETHTYRDDRGHLPSVTQVLKGAGLIDSRWYSQEAAERGSAVHLACALHDDGALDESSVDPAVAPYLDAWKKFLADAKPEMGLIEKRLSHPFYRYAGTLDRTMQISGAWYVVDIKSGQCQPWAAIQTAAYAACLPQPHGRMAVELHGDGTYRIFKFSPATADRTDLKIFTAALAVYQWKVNNGISVD